MRLAAGSLIAVAALACIGPAGEPSPAGSAPLPRIPEVPPIPTIGTPDTVSPEWRSSSDRLAAPRRAISADVPKDLPPIPTPADEPRSLAPPPKLEPKPTGDAKSLMEEIGSLAKDRDTLNKSAQPDGGSDERTRLRMQLQDLVKKLETQKKKPTADPHKSADPHKAAAATAHAAAKPDLLDGTNPIDSLRLAVQLFKLGDADQALRAFRLIDPTALSKEDRAFTRYMIACCLRQAGKADEAVKIFREITNAKEDPFLTECALWQLAAIRSVGELETQLEQLRSRRKAR